MRAAAATLVVFQHAVYHAQTARGGNYVNEFPINYGRLGVVIFFAISGFVIALNRHQTPGEFALRRMLRIYPAYWFATLLTIAGLATVGMRSSTSWAALLLWPSAMGAPLEIPYWTLVYEIAFYAVATAFFFPAPKRSRPDNCLPFLDCAHQWRRICSS